MILIADSGSTKTSWCMTDGKASLWEHTSEGINPYFQNREQIQASVSNIREALPVGLNISNIFYYGSGCGSAQNKKLMHEVFTALFPAVEAEVHTDLMGASRAACGREEGIAAILGTGSNSCFYNGEDIIKNNPSLGFILGDEGSGAYIGKKFIEDFLNGYLPETLSKDFVSKYQLNKDAILEAVYKKPYPNRFLASFVKYLSIHKQDDYVHQLIEASLEAFVVKNVFKYDRCHELSLNCVGSIAFNFRDLLQKVCSEKGIHLGKVLESPLEQIAAFHHGL